MNNENLLNALRASKEALRDIQNEANAERSRLQRENRLHNRQVLLGLLAQSASSANSIVSAAAAALQDLE